MSVNAPVIPPDITNDATSYSPRLQFVLFGDSLTQRGSEPEGWVSLLAHYYSRKADAFNRGYSGYNTNHAAALLKQHIKAGIWPTSTAASSSSSSAAGPQTIMTLYFGANDSCLKDGHSAQQAVSLDQYRANLEEIVTILKGADGAANPSLHLIIIGPPQCDAHSWGVVSKQRHGLDFIPITRDNEYTAKFAAIAGEVAQKFKLPFVDSYAFTPKAEWNELLCDGLHFTPKGNTILFEKVRDTIKQAFPELAAEKLKLDSFPFGQITMTDKAATEDFFQTIATK